MNYKLDYSLMKELEYANYNTESNKKGWSYAFCTGFINNHDLTKEQLEEIYINSPALQTFMTITPEMKKDKIILEETTKAKIEAFNIEMTNHRKEAA